MDLDWMHVLQIPALSLKKGEPYEKDHFSGKFVTARGFRASIRLCRWPSQKISRPKRRPAATNFFIGNFPLRVC
jgi:hypothetical protein